MRLCTAFRAVSFVILAGSVTVALASCKHREAKPNSPAVSPTSSIVVHNAADGIHIESQKADFLLTANGNLTASPKDMGATRGLDESGAAPGITVTIGNRMVSDLQRDLNHPNIQSANGKLGTLGKRVYLHGHSAGSGLDEQLTVEVYDDFPSLALLSAQYTNPTQREIPLTNVTLQRHRLNAAPAENSAKPREIWAFFGSSLKWGKDEILAIPASFSQRNPLGAPVETSGDLGQVGGGIPVAAFWTANSGLAIGHLETLPLAVAIPTQTTPDHRIDTAIDIPAGVTLKPGESFATPRTFVAVYRGDFYEPLRLWSTAVDREGLTSPESNSEDYAVSWCGWGYESDVTPQQMLGTIPKLKELGIHWATLDDRWFNNYGDWQPRTDKFAGDAIQKMVKDFHRDGIKVQLWWLPLAVEDGRFRYGHHKYVVSDVVKEHPDWLVLDEKGQPARMTRNLATLCPAVPEVREYYKKLTERFIREWDFDGHKLDNIYSTPRCYNPKHRHKSPMDSVYAMGDVYKTIFETTRSLKPDSVTQSCPCGTPPSLAWLRYMDQAVTADPVGSIQVRRRIKMYKALLGPHAAVYGDHVELTRIVGADTGNEEDLGDDFASTLGAGGVLGTKFTWPDYGTKFTNVYLSERKNAHWKKWIGLYNEKMLSKGDFRDLYVYGYDTPEAYAIEKDGVMYYAFYAPQPGGTGQAVTRLWHGEIELRGLKDRSYRVSDYVNRRDLGTVQGPTARLTVEFSGSLLLEAR